jgi:hypothetical protein
MSIKLLTITETRLNHNAVWWKNFQETASTSTGVTLTPQDRSNWYNIQSVGQVDPDIQGTPPIPDDGVYKGEWSTFLSGDGLEYSVMVKYDENYPVTFYEPSHESYTARLQYCEDNAISISSTVTDVTSVS